MVFFVLYKKYITLSPNLQEQEYLNLIIGETTKISYNYFAMSLVPAFSYYLNQHFAINLETGNFKFNIIDWEWQWLFYLIMAEFWG